MSDQEQQWAVAKRRYWERGWTVVEGVFAAERVAKVAVLAQEIGYQDLQRTPASEMGDYLFDRAHPAPPRHARSAAPIPATPIFVRWCSIPGCVRCWKR